MSARVLQDFLLLNVHVHRQGFFHWCAMIAARAKAVFAANHQESDALVINGIAQRLQLHRVKSIRNTLRPSGASAPPECRTRLGR